MCCAHVEMDVGDTEGCCNAGDMCSAHVVMDVGDTEGWCSKTWYCKAGEMCIEHHVT